MNMTTARLIGAAIPVLLIAAALLLAACTGIHHLRQRHHQRRDARARSGFAPLLTRHLVIHAALTDWWVTADPIRPDLRTAAHEVECLLAEFGYRISPTPEDTMPPTRAQTALTITLALLALAAAVISAARHEWWWVMAAAGACGAFAYEAAGSITDRRRARNRTPRP